MYAVQLRLNCLYSGEIASFLLQILRRGHLSFYFKCNSVFFWSAGFGVDRWNDWWQFNANISKTFMLKNVYFYKVESIQGTNVGKLCLGCLWTYGLFYVCGCMVCFMSGGVWFVLCLRVYGLFYVWGVWFVLCLGVYGLFYVWGCMVCFMSVGVWFVLCLWMMHSLFRACVRIDFVDAVTMRGVLKCAFFLSHRVWSFWDDPCAIDVDRTWILKSTYLNVLWQVRLDERNILFAMQLLILSVFFFFFFFF